MHHNRSPTSLGGILGFGRREGKDTPLGRWWDGTVGIPTREEKSGAGGKGGREVEVDVWTPVRLVLPVEVALYLLQALPSGLKGGDHLASA
jgi:hypothetical protein